MMYDDIQIELTPISRWYNDIRAEVPDAPNPLVRDKVLEAAIEFSKRTLASYGALDPHDITANQPVIQLEPPHSCLLIWRVLWVKTADRILQPTARHQANDGMADWERGSGRDPIAWVQLREDTIQLVPAPTETIVDALHVQCAFIPRWNVDRIDERFWIFWREAIMAGALAKLFRMRSQPWFDPSGAGEREHEFQVELARATANKRKDASVADLSVQMRPF